MGKENNICILAVSGPLKGHKFLVKSDSPILIGRSEDADMRITYDNYCSRKHAAVYWEENACFIEDFDSTNGTFVNDRRICGREKLKNKDIIALGQTELLVLVADNQSMEKSFLTSLNDFKVGYFIAGIYEITRILEGGMGIVYVCRANTAKHATDDRMREVALKTLKRNTYTEKDAEIFLKEANIWIGFNAHPHIVQAYFVTEFNGIPFIGLELIAPDAQGRSTLAHYIGSLTIGEILKFSIQFCYGMEYAYSKGIEAHGDIKPDNIMITGDKTVKITDFGLARVLKAFDVNDIISKDVDSNRFVFRDHAGMWGGTLPYMSPEQFDGYTDVRCDVYAFGVVLYQMITNGEFPFIGRNPEEFERLHKTITVPFFYSPLSGVIIKCLQKNPANRYQNFSSIREELQNMLWGETGEVITQPEIKKVTNIQQMAIAGSLIYLGKFKEAVACFSAVLENTPTDADAWSGKGSALDELGRYEEAIICFDKALEINAGDNHAWSCKGLALSNAGSHEWALICCDKAIELDSGSDFSLHCKGYVLANVGRHDDAIICFSKALEINRWAGDSWGSKGLSLNELDRYEEAIICFDKALEIQPRYVAALCNKGIALSNLGRYEEEINCYDRALEINPRDIPSQTNMGLILNKLSRHEEAVTCYNKVLDIDAKNVTAWCSKGVALYGLGRYGEAFFCYNKALEIDSLDLNSWDNKGLALYELGKYEEAVICYDKVLEIDSKKFEVWCSKGACLYELGRNMEADICFDKALEMSPNYAPALAGKGLSLASLDKHEEAIVCYNKALEIAPDEFSNWWCNKGTALECLGRHEEALICFNKATEIDSNSDKHAEIKPQPYEDGLIYVPDKDAKPVVVYADMDGDKRDEMVTAYQMHSTDDNGFPRSFAYVYTTDGKRNPMDLLQIIPLNEYLGDPVDDNEAHDKILEIIDLNNDGKKEVAIWSSGGFHYNTLFIIGMKDGMVVPIFYNGSRCPIKYEPTQNKNIISIGREDWPKHSFAEGTYLEEIWEWNGKEFVYSKAKSTFPILTEDEDIDIYWKMVLNGHILEDGTKTPGMQLKTEEEKKEWEYRFKYAHTGMLQDETMDLKKIWEDAIELQQKQDE
jgi:tetratricopeptide (TPR) repeat protein